MPTKILLIENDAALASALTQALESRGFEVRDTADGKDGLDLAREWSPQGIVLCVELPGMSGYLVCQRLKKDESLKAIPLVLTSAEATEETFEKHRALKVRADEYLFKPYGPQALVDAVERVVGLAEPPVDDEIPRPDDDDLGEEELVSLEDSMGLEALPTEPVEDLPALDLSALPDDEPIAGGRGAAGSVDDELRLLDDAFEELAAPSAAAAADEDDLELELGLGLDAQEDSEPLGLDDLAAERDEEDRPDAELALDALGDEGAGLPLPEEEDRAPEPAPPARGPLRGASADLLRAAGIPLLDDDPPRQARASANGDTARLERELEDVRARADESEVALAGARGELEGLAARARRAEVDAAEARRRAEDAERRASLAEAEARKKADEAAGAVARAAQLEQELEGLRADLLVAREEAAGAHGEVEKRTGELRKRVQELEAANAKNEDRVLRAYQKIKGDEKVREKVRKALAIAAQLLDEEAPQDTLGAREPRAATPPPRP
ncbi:response regulator transcription factor [Anaeromyxobacter sp. Fw109-5]|uniref:response regulator transcription factor n=1 Tax=Anaeromyxobacter sp. (strain Fw109-5) TaxID=404589 RepID=UPI000158A64C|nr:response regulator [Anaeromyxobacter sp. Fw109-5]ABS25694.1 response regulator receiver protein [Anaeromyxobacter sp. Fw109-5]